MRSLAARWTRAFRATSWWVVTLGALIAATIPVGAAEIRVYSGGAPQAALKLFSAEFEQSKITLRNAIDGGVALVANGDVEIGMFLVSETLPVKSVTLVGLLPSQLQSYVVYAGAVAVGSASPEPALAFVRFLSDAAKREHWKAAGFEPLSRAE